MIDWSKPLSRHPGVIEEVVEDEIVLLMPHAGSVLVLNDVGRTIWSRIDGLRTATLIAELVCIEYEVEPEQARSDTVAFLEALLARGLIALAGEAPS